MESDNPFLSAYKKRLDDQPGQQVEAPPGPGVEPVARPLHYQEGPTFIAPRPLASLAEQAQPTPGLAEPAAPSVARPFGATRTRVFALAIFGAFLLVAALFLYGFLNRGTEVIDLTGWTLSDAQLWASDNGVNLQVSKEYNDQFEADKVLDQDLKAGMRIKKGFFLKTRVSQGHDLNVSLPLPDLLGMTKTQVEAWAAQNFMAKVRLTAEYSEKVATGRVIRFEINDDTVVDLVKRNTPVYVIVSKGMEPKIVAKVELPNFKEMQLAQCQSFASEHGLILNIINQYDDLAPAGTILSQSIAAAQTVDSGTEVTLTISKGKLILVPDFSAYSRQKAAAVAQEAGITIAVTERYSARATGLFLSQSLVAGATYSPGAVLELAYSLGNRIVIASFVGQTRAAIETWAKELNAQGASIRVSITQTQNNAPQGTIIQQAVANTVIATDATVRITVSLGKMVFVPNLVAPEGSVYGQIVTREKAAAACSSLGLVPVFQSERKSGRLPGEVWSQSVSPGKDVYEGSTIVLKYCPADTTVMVVDFSGKTREQIIAEGWQVKLDIDFATADAPVPGFVNQVHRQSVPAGSIVASGTAITLTISPAD